MNLHALFGADTINYENIQDLMRDSPNLILLAAPAMFFFVILEYIISSIQNRGYYNKRETFGSIMVGIGNVLIGLILKGVLFFVFVMLYNAVPWRMELQWWTLLPCYVIFDFLSFVTHHISHRVRILWATHVAHHSGEHYNLTVSFRLSWIQYVKIIFIFPVALIGFHPVIIFISSQLATLFQFWVHTEYIKKLHPIIEYLLATPSNHRVHHGSQPQYINKNYGATFIIWDRIFGTYKEEEEKVVYGITTNIANKANPIEINFHELREIIKDVRSTTSLRKKLFYIFGDPIEVAAEKESGSVKRKAA